MDDKNGSIFHECTVRKKFFLDPKSTDRKKVPQRGEANFLFSKVFAF